MRKTLFAGLTVLEADESLIADDGAFIGRDRDTIDRLLEIGAKTHRHSGLPGLESPSSAVPAVQAIPSGGSLDPDTTFTIGYTLEDEENGETMVSPVAQATTQPPLAFPEQAPTAVIDYADGGTLLVDTYYYGITHVDAEGGETPIGAWATVEREPGFTNARVLLSALDDGLAGASAVAWRLYRAVGGGTFDYLSSGTGDAFADDGSVAANCDIHPPPDEVNTTNQVSQLRVVLPSPEAVGEAAFINLYGSITGDLIGEALLGTYPASSAGQTVFFTTFDPAPGMPPDTNQSIGGASKIDPDFEILDWHWKRPVASAGALPDGEFGDVRLVLDSGEIMGMLRNPSGDTSEWTVLGSAGSGGGGGGSGIIAREIDGVPTVDPTTILEFIGNGVVVTDEGGGVARVSIYPSAAPGGGGGGGSGITVRGINDSGDPLPFQTVPGAEFLDLVVGDEYPELSLEVGIGEDETHARVTGQAVTPRKVWSSAASVTLSSGASAMVNDDLSAFASELAFEISTNKSCRVTIYSDEAARLADVGRAIGASPVGDNHGVLLDRIVGPSSGAKRRETPSKHIYSLMPETWPPDPDHPERIQTVAERYMTLTNLDSDGDVTAAFGLIPGPDKPTDFLLWGSLLLGSFGKIGFVKLPSTPGGSPLYDFAGTVDVGGMVCFSEGTGRSIVYYADGNNNAIGWIRFPSLEQGFLDTTGATIDNPVGLAYDDTVFPARLIWANGINGSSDGISWAAIDGSGGGDLNVSGATCTGPGGVAIDFSSGRVYWGNSTSFAGIAQVSWAALDNSGGGDLDMTGGPGGGNIQKCAIDSVLGRVIFALDRDTGGGANDRIGYANTDDSGAGVIDTTGASVRQPWGLTILNDYPDFNQRRIIWANTASPKGLYYADADGAGGGNLTSNFQSIPGNAKVLAFGQ